MARKFVFPNGALIDGQGRATQAGLAFLRGIEDGEIRLNTAGELTLLSGDTNTTNMSAKIDAIITALKAS